MWKRTFVSFALLVAGGVAGLAASRLEPVSGLLARLRGAATMPAVDSHEAAGESHAGHEGHDHAHRCLHLSEEAIRQFGIETAEARGGTLRRMRTLPAEISLNADRVAHIVPRVTGMVREVFKNQGDAVRPGEVMAVLESRELAEAKAFDLAAEARLALARSNHERLDRLRAGKIAPEQEYFEAKQRLEEAAIQHREAQAKLHALGLTAEQIAGISSEKDFELSRYEIKAPFGGTIIEKHITLGEVVSPDRDVFVLADLATVWADIAVYAQDAEHVREGAKVRLTSPTGGGATEATIFYVSPVLQAATRTGLARALVTNDSNRWKPGCFLTAEIVAGEDPAGVLVPRDAVQTIDGHPSVFVADAHEFEPRPVTLGHRDDASFEVVAGLKPGERYVVKGAVFLKAEWNKGEGGHEH